jgi:hypothetical protein
MITYPHEQILGYCKSGLYAFINIDQQKIDVRYAKDINLSIATIISQINHNVMDTPDLSKDFLDNKISIVILEEYSSNKFNNLVRQSYWCEKYKQLGYTLYRNKPLVKLTVETALTPRGIRVYLRSSRYKRIEVGLFEDLKQAQDFIYLNYPNGLVKEVIKK